MRAYWRGLFPGEIPEVPVLPELFDGDSIDLDGHELRVIDIGQGDIEHSTIVHVPWLRAVVAGDVVYNKVHMLTVLTDATAREAWIASIGSIAALDPDIVVAGHKRVGAPGSRDAIEQSEHYLRGFLRIAAESDTARADRRGDAGTARRPGQPIHTAVGVPLGNSVSCRELGFGCGISGVAGTISRCCCRSPTAC